MLKIIDIEISSMLEITLGFSYIFLIKLLSNLIMQDYIKKKLKFSKFCNTFEIYKVLYM